MPKQPKKTLQRTLQQKCWRQIAIFGPLDPSFSMAASLSLLPFVLVAFLVVAVHAHPSSLECGTDASSRLKIGAKIMGGVGSHRHFICYDSRSSGMVVIMAATTNHMAFITYDLSIGIRIDDIPFRQACYLFSHVRQVLELCPRCVGQTSNVDFLANRQ